MVPNPSLGLGKRVVNKWKTWLPNGSTHLCLLARSLRMRRDNIGATASLEVFGPPDAEGSLSRREDDGADILERTARLANNTQFAIKTYGTNV